MLVPHAMSQARYSLCLGCCNACRTDLLAVQHVCGVVLVGGGINATSLVDSGERLAMEVWIVATEEAHAGCMAFKSDVWLVASRGIGGVACMAHE